MTQPEELSYDPNRMPNGFEAELARLRHQALITWEKEARLLGGLGLRDGMAVLELGSGPGFVTEQLLRLVPAGQVVAVDQDPVLLARAVSYLQGQGGRPAALVRANVLGMGLADNRFDFVIGRYLFQHLPDPVAAAKEAYRVLKPGGTLVVVDVDDDLNLFDPRPQGAARAIADRLTEAFQQEQARRGGNRLVGRRLPQILGRAGFQQLDLDALVLNSHITDLNNLAPRPTRDSFAPQLAAGLLTEQELDVLLADMEAFERSDHVILLTLLVASGRKPA